MNFVYFTDRDLGKRFAEILRSAGLTVERHADHFVHDAADEVWLEEIGKRGWIVLTHDRRIRYKPNELNAVMQNAVAMLAIVGAARICGVPREAATRALPWRGFFFCRAPITASGRQCRGRCRAA